MAQTMAELQASIEAKLEGDTDFQSSLEGLSDEDKTLRLNERKQSEMDAELSRLADEAAAKKKSDELYLNQKTRAEKAEEEVKKLRQSKGGESLTAKDMVAITNAKINTEDFDTVVEWAAFKKIPVADALKDKILQTALREKEEERQTAAATATRGGRSMTKDTPEEIVSRASKGQLPEDDEGIAKLAEAHQQLKLNKLQR